MARRPMKSRGAFLLLTGQEENVAVRKQMRHARACSSALASMLIYAGIAAAQAPVQLFGVQRQFLDQGVRVEAGQANSLASAPTPSAFAEFTDEVGRHVRVPRPVQRIVSLAPSLTETVYALGAQDRLVGDTDFCDYPADAQKKTKVGGAINPNIEQIVALRPDLVLVTKGLNRFDTVRALDDLHVPAYATDPHTVDDVISSTERLAGVLGISEAGQSLAKELRQRLAELDSKLAALPPRRVLFVVWPEPLISAGRKTFVADALRHAGAVSVIDSAQDWPQVNLEEVVRLQPDVLVFASSHGETVAKDFEVLAQKPGWRDLHAVRGKRFAVISDAVNRPAPRLISAIEDLARQLHPEAFQESGKEKTESPPPRAAKNDHRISGSQSCRDPLEMALLGAR